MIEFEQAITFHRDGLLTDSQLLWIVMGKVTESNYLSILYHLPEEVIDLMESSIEDYDPSIVHWNSHLEYIRIDPVGHACLARWLEARRGR